MTELEKAARQALEALEGMTKDLGRFPEDVAAIASLRQALENHESAYQRGYLDGMAKPCIDCADRKLQAMKQPKQKPVAWMYDWKTEGLIVTDWVTSDKDEAYSPTKGYVNIRPLYTKPPKRKPLTDEEICQMADATPVDEISCAADTWHIRFARAIEAAHGIKE